MKFLLIGSGGREHALAWALAASPIVSKLYCAPGNAGIAEVAECVPIPVNDLDGLVAFAKAKGINFVVIGPEAPLVAGLWDRLESAGIKALGPSARGAMLEGSKGFLKELCREHAIPTAGFARFQQRDAAVAYAAVDRSRLASLQVWIWIAGTIVMTIGVALVHSGRAIGDPIAAVSSLVVLADAVLFGWLVFRGDSTEPANQRSTVPAE